jgi:type III secretory pathway component EscT
LGRVSGSILKGFGVAPRLVDAGPKRFAARIGLLFSVALVVLAQFDIRTATEIVAAILLVCAALESFLGFCLGCQMWTFWYALLDRISGGRSNGRAT